ncbi:RNA polymerase sigma factor [Candidatus Sumerlaeota bacterium]|nr:RNA polymerase sigma factor [Candidatus Sumerlaeota bacterium]
MALSQVSPLLIDQCRNGDRDAMESLISEISPDLYRIIFSIVHDHDDTDEILQETLIRLFRYIGALKDIQRFPAWVMRIAVNQVQTFRVRKNRNRLYEISDSREISNSAVVLNGVAPEDPSEKLQREQMRQEITEAMDSLPERQKMATVLFELEGMPIKEIASVMQCSEGAVKFSIHEGRKKLKRRLIHLVQGLRWGKRHASESAGSMASSQFGLRRFSSEYSSPSQSDSRMASGG